MNLATQAKRIKRERLLHELFNCIQQWSEKRGNDMCGINGICGFKGNLIENIRRMNERIIRRGPDSGNYWLDENAGLALGHRRLAIVDLTENGAQPMISSDQRYVMVFNGEIYNKDQVWEHMLAKNIHVTLRGTSDTEVILESFANIGIEETLNLMKGMFAIGLYDRQDKMLYLMRDRMGEKPVYYGYVNDTFVFSSDIGAITAIDGFDNPIRSEVLPLYFRGGYIPAPYTIYEKLYKLEAGRILKIRAPFDEKSIQLQTYWDIKEVAVRGQDNPFMGTEKEAADELERLLKESIKGQLMSDVPLGAFLSGGIDSSLTVALMQQLCADQVKTFTIGFEEKGYNEAEYAKEIAAHIGTKHTEMYVGFKEAMEALSAIPEAFTEPFADSSQIPTMLVSKMTREHVTVSLSGDAGDELFCGYNTYKDLEDSLALIKSKAGFLPKPVRTGIGKAAQLLDGPDRQLLHKIGDVFTTNDLETCYVRMGTGDSRVAYLCKNRGGLKDTNDLYEHGYLRKGKHNLMLMDMLRYLPDDILVKVDRAGMYYSLESRIPLLDKDIVEFAWTLPLGYKMQDGVSKRVMRDVLYRYVPKELLERPKKGFSVPVSEWLRDKNYLRDWAESIRHDSRDLVGEFIDLRLEESLWKDYVEKGEWKEAIWSILMLEQWLLARKTGRI